MRMYILAIMSQPKALPIIAFLVFVVSLALLFPFHSQQFSHSDEGFYFQAAREMRLNSDYITPTFEKQNRFQKPPFYYWIVAGAYNLFGESERAARLTSTFFGAVTLLLIFIALSYWQSVQLALMSVLGVITSYGFFSMSHYAITDITLNAFIVASLLIYWENFRKEKRSTYLIWSFFALLGLAFLTKGPPGIAIPIIAIFFFALFRRETKALDPIKSPPALGGWWIFIVITLPWFLILWRIHGDAYLNFLTNKEITTRLSANHRGVFYIFLSYFLYISPWTLLFPLMFDWKRIKSNKFYLFLVSWILSPIFLFALVPNKHSYYILPSIVPTIVLIISLAKEAYSSSYIKKLYKFVSVGLITTLVISGIGLYLTWPLIDNHLDFIILFLLIAAASITIFLIRPKSFPNQSPSLSPNLSINRLISFIALFFLVIFLFAYTLAIPHLTKRPEYNYAAQINKENKERGAKIISYKWHSKRLVNILKDRKIFFVENTFNLERELNYPGPIYLIADRDEYNLLPQEFKSHLEILDSRQYWRRSIHAGRVLQKLALRDYGWFNADLLLLRTR